ncbi:MAG: hypothetical protein ACREQJ_00345, partial [Candidatus Binatia bacterium]
LSVAESGADSAHGGPITHSTRIALVDGAGRIRRYYLDGVEPWTEMVLSDLDALESEGARG